MISAPTQAVRGSIVKALVIDYNIANFGLKFFNNNAIKVDLLLPECPTIPTFSPALICKLRDWHTLLPSL